MTWELHQDRSTVGDVYSRIILLQDKPTAG